MKKLAAGIDIGGTNSVIGLIDRAGNLVAESNFRTDEFPVFEEYVERIGREIETLTAATDGNIELAGIGIGAPNANHYGGHIERPVNIRWTFRDAGRPEGIFPIVELLAHRFPTLPVVVTNDANAAAVGEMIYGGAKGMKDFVVITLGTGLGSGFVSDGELIYGHDSFAGELGHVVIDPAGRACGCGRKGCLETYVSATGIKRTVFQLMAETTLSSRFRHIAFDDLKAEMITDAARQGDPLALQAFEFTGKILGLAIANAVTITSPEAVFLFGGLAKAGRYLFDPTRRSMEQNMLYVFRDKVKLLPSGIDGDKNAAVLGASALVWQELDRRERKA